MKIHEPSPSDAIVATSRGAGASQGAKIKAIRSASLSISFAGPVFAMTGICDDSKDKRKTEPFDPCFRQTTLAILGPAVARSHARATSSLRLASASALVVAGRPASSAVTAARHGRRLDARA